jgi:hypothetical protein
MDGLRIAARIGTFLTFLKGYRIARKAYRAATKRWPLQPENGYA